MRLGGHRNSRVRFDEGLLPEHECPVARQRDRTERHRDQGRAADTWGKQVGHRRRLAPLLRLGPFLRLGYGLTNPESHESRQHADKKNPARFEAGEKLEHFDGKNGEEDAEIHGALQDGGDPGAPLFWPGFGE